MGRRRSLGRVAAAAALLLVVPAAKAPTAFDPVRLERELRTEPGVLGVLVERNDRLLFERYYHGSSANAQLGVFSITKSVTSTLIGIALAEGKLGGLDERLGHFFPKEVHAASDRRVRKITLRQLLTMTAGYALEPATRSDHWVQTLIQRPLTTDPGRRFSYDGGSYHLLSAVLAKATGMSTKRFADRVLFGPLDIRVSHWDSDHEGYNLGDTGLRLRARDLLRFGEFYLHHGRWRGRRLLPSGYERDATRWHSGLGGGIGYGYGWWILANRRPTAFAALGYGGQAIAVFPSLRAVVVIQGGGDDRERVLYRLVLPELLKP